MPAIRRLLDRFHPVEDHHERDQAVIDLMELVMLADHRSGQAERELIEHFVDTRSWPPPASPDAYQQESMARVRAAMADRPGTEALITSIVQRLPTHADRVYALELLRDMALAEGAMPALEAELVAELTARLTPSG